MITLQNLSLQRGVKPLLDAVNLTIHPGQRVALIGANGTGKTSLFKLLLGELNQEAGELSIPRQWRVAHMAQEIAASAQSALDFVLDGDAELRVVQRNIALAESNHDHTALAHHHLLFDTLDGYTANSRAEILLRGLGFVSSDSARPVSSFSGGWRMRLGLAQAMMCRSDLLLLDEPTNHLDLDATLWVEKWLTQYRGTLLLISHDREFIDAVVTHIAHLEQQKIILYAGNYSAFETQRAAQLANQQGSFEKQQRQIADLERFITRFKAKASKAKQAQSRVKQLERMEKIAPAHVDSPFNFSFSEPDKLSDPLLKLDHADIGYADNIILHDVTQSIRPGMRLGLLGANGAGKSTFLRSLTAELPLIKGARITGENLNVAYFAQDQLQALDLNASPLLHLQRLSPHASEQSLRSFLGGFDFQGDQALSAITHFSGGEKARLALAICVWKKPSLLVMDEPTNHLDLEMRHALTMALQAYTGALIVVSHDRYLLRNTVDELLLIANGHVSIFAGDLLDYQQLLLNQTNDTVADARQDGKTVDKKMLRQQQAEQRRLLKPLTDKIKLAETEMQKLQQALAKIIESLNNQDLYTDANRAKLQAALQQQGQLKNALDVQEQLWLSLMEELEIVQNQMATEAL
ncbi:MAG: ATP-binding cassette domain-containing protein [Gammaproteobacteria bacterium]|nr:ATP-binding cassette domain-containing protein [Gammaproteobacteria bacterium]